MRKAIFAAAAALAVTLGSAGAAAAYTPAPNGGAVVVSPGSTVAIQFEPVFLDGESVTFTLTGENAAGATLAPSKSITTTANAAGKASVTITMPAEGGEFVGTVFDGDGQLVSTFDIASGTTTGAAGAAGSGGDELSSTGFSSAGIALGAGALLIVGAGAVVIGARRRNASVDA